MDAPLILSDEIKQLRKNFDLRLAHKRKVSLDKKTPLFLKVGIILAVTVTAASVFIYIYPNRSDASYHDGYTWAEERGITNPNDCNDNSQSFVEGCHAYAKEKQLDHE